MLYVRSDVTLDIQFTEHKNYNTFITEETFVIALLQE